MNPRLKDLVDSKHKIAPHQMNASLVRLCAVIETQSYGGFTKGIFTVVFWCVLSHFPFRLARKNISLVAR